MSVPFNLAVGVLALTIDGIFGYPAAIFSAIGHPVTWVGALIRDLDKRFNVEADSGPRRRRLGMVSLLILLGVAAGLSLAFQSLVIDLLPRAAGFVLLALAVTPCLAQRSLDEHVRAVREALDRAGLGAGRTAVSMIVGRDTALLDEAGVCRAAIESLAENFSDGIVAPALYLGFGGLAGGMLYKTINTADSMIGHRTPRYEQFGFAAAKLDDLVNWPAARLSALWIVLAAFTLPGASGSDAWRIMRRDARGHPSPNAGWPEAAMAGALGIMLGGPRAYGGQIVQDATMGDAVMGDAVMGDTGVADADTIGRALVLYRIACTFNAVAILLAAITCWIL